MISFRTSIASAICALLLLATASGLASAGEVGVKVPFCEEVNRGTGDYEIRSELVREPFWDHRIETIPGECVIETTTVAYTAYRLKSEWVERVVEATRTVSRPVVKWVRKVRSWFEQTWLGKLVKRVVSWLEPVTTWIKETIVDRVVQSVKVVTTEPYTAYRTERTRVCSPPKQTSVSFINHRLVRKPTRVEITIPGYKIVYRTVRVDRRDIPASVIEDLFRRLPACEPLGGRLQKIYAIWNDLRDGLAQYAHAEQRYDDALYIYLHGVPSEGWPAQTSAFADGFGDGPGAWANFTVADASAAQYFRMRELLQEWGLVTAYEAGTYQQIHNNLCGELAVIAALGDTVPHGLAVFHSTDQGKAIIRGNDTTGWWDLEDFFAQYDGWAAGSTTGAMSQRELAGELQQGEAVIALVSLNAGNGLLEQGDQGHIAHWVTVLEVLPTQDGQGAVRVYNSFQNREEYYTWAYFYDAWSRTNGNSSTFLRVTAQRDLAQEPSPPTPEIAQHPEQTSTTEHQRLTSASGPEGAREENDKPSADVAPQVDNQHDQLSGSQTSLQSEGDGVFPPNHARQEREIQRREREAQRRKLQVNRATPQRHTPRRSYFAE